MELRPESLSHGAYTGESKKYAAMLGRTLDATSTVLNAETVGNPVTVVLNKCLNDPTKPSTRVPEVDGSEHR